MDTNTILEKINKDIGKLTSSNYNSYNLLEIQNTIRTSAKRKFENKNAIDIEKLILLRTKALNLSKKYDLQFLKITKDLATENENETENSNKHSKLYSQLLKLYVEIEILEKKLNGKPFSFIEKSKLRALALINFSIFFLKKHAVKIISWSLYLCLAALSFIPFFPILINILTSIAARHALPQNAMKNIFKDIISTLIGLTSLLFMIFLPISIFPLTLIAIISATIICITHIVLNKQADAKYEIHADKPAQAELVKSLTQPLLRKPKQVVARTHSAQAGLASMGQDYKDMPPLLTKAEYEALQKSRDTLKKSGATFFGTYAKEKSGNSDIELADFKQQQKEVPAIPATSAASTAG